MIFYEKNLAPKNYIYKYINNENQINTVMKTKGIPKKQLKEKYYNDESGKVKFILYPLFIASSISTLL